MPFFNLVFWSAFVVLVALSARPAQAATEVKKICHVNDKTKKEVCKNIKSHKKVEGTKVPEPTKKK